MSMFYDNVIADAMLFHLLSTDAWPISNNGRRSGEVFVRQVLQYFLSHHNHTSWTHNWSNSPVGHAVLFCSPRTGRIPRVL